MYEEIADNIAKIKEILLERGRCNTFLEMSNGSVCLIGAGLYAMGVDNVKAFEDELESSNVYPEIFKDNATFKFLAEMSPVHENQVGDWCERIWRLNDNEDDDQVIFDFLDECQIKAKMLFTEEELAKK